MFSYGHSVGKRLFAEVFHVVINGGGHHAHRFLAAADLVDGCGLVFEVFVHRKEVPHLIKNMGGQLVDVGILVVVGIVEGDGDDLFVSAAVIDHGDDADGVGTHQCERLERLGAEQQHVERIVIVAVGTGNEAVVGRVVGGRVQDAVEDDVARLLVQLVFLFTAF